MTGIIAQLIALVSFGNEYLETGELIDGFYPENTTFQFCNSVIFVVFKKALFSSKPNESVIAGDPVKWLELLKKEGCKKLASISKVRKINPKLRIIGWPAWLVAAALGSLKLFTTNIQIFGSTTGRLRIKMQQTEEFGQ